MRRIDDRRWHRKGRRLDTTQEQPPQRENRCCDADTRPAIPDGVLIPGQRGRWQYGQQQAADQGYREQFPHGVSLLMSLSTTRSSWQPITHK